VELEASGEEVMIGCLNSFFGFEVDAAASARALAAVSFEPNISVKIDSREVLISVRFAHLKCSS